MSAAPEAPAPGGSPAAPATPALALQDRAARLALRLPPLLVAARQVAATVATGVHGRRRVGIGETFWQYRPYQPGDAAQAIDWRQSAKGERLFVRENEWEAVQTVWLQRDASPSMEWRSADSLPTKRARADLLTMALAILLSQAGEHVGLLGGARAPGTGRLVLERLAEALSDPAPGEALPGPLTLARSRLRWFATVVLVGDFLAPLPDLRTALGGLAGRGLAGHLLQVLDPAELTLPYAGRVRFQGVEGGAEGGDELIPRVDAIRPAYLKRLEEHQAELREIARRAGWTLLTHRTDRPPQAALLALFGVLSGSVVG